MTLDKKLREILMKYTQRVKDIYRSNGITQAEALTAIKKAFEEELPKWSGTYDYDDSESHEAGFNECLFEIKQKLWWGK